MDPSLAEKCLKAIVEFSRKRELEEGGRFAKPPILLKFETVENAKAHGNYEVKFYPKFPPPFLFPHAHLKHAESVFLGEGKRQVEE